MKLRIAVFPTVDLTAVTVGHHAAFFAGRPFYGAAISEASLDGFISAFNDDSADAACTASNHRVTAFRWEQGVAFIFADSGGSYGEANRIGTYSASNNATAPLPSSGSVANQMSKGYLLQDVDDWAGTDQGWIRNTNALAAVVAAFVAGRVTS